MQTIIRYTLLTASRDLLFIGLFLLILLAYGLSSFMAGTALVEESQTGLAYFAGSCRFILITGLIVFVCFHVRRAFDNREIEAVLSKPISRTQFVLGYWLGFCVLSFIVSIPVVIVMYTLTQPNLFGLIAWGVSFYFETLLVLAFALVASLILRSAVVAVMSSLAFYIISRLMGFFIAAIDSPTSLTGSAKFGSIMEYILKIISTVIPRLDLYAKSSWLIYGIEQHHDIWIFPVQSLIYIPFLLALAVFDFKRKQF